MKEVYVIFQCYDTQAEIRKWPIEKAYSTLDAVETAFLELEENNTDVDTFYEIFTFPLDKAN